MGRQEWQEMTPKTIICARELPSGEQCEALAVITSIQYVYDQQPSIGKRDDQILREIHYRVVCPFCGERTIIDSEEP